MKKLIFAASGLWVIIILIVVVVMSEPGIDEGAYRVNINRIHSRLSSDWETNMEVLAALSEEEKGVISSVNMLDIENMNREIHEQETGSAEGHFSSENFFNIDDISSNPSTILPVEDSSYLVKYSIEGAAGENRGQIILICSIISIIFLIFIIGLIYVYKYIIHPMKRVSLLPEKLASGYIGELNVFDKNQYFNKFIWGLDMLRVKLQDERNRNRELEKERKTLVASLSHDIKTPLSSIKNYSIALKEGIYEDTIKQERALDIILEKTEVIERITKELLESSLDNINTSALKVTVEDIYMSEIAKRLNQIIKHKAELLHIDYIYPEIIENFLVLADLDALSQVFDNIVENAVKYGDMNRIQVSYHQEEYYQLINIENTGKPIEDRELKHIFSSYYRGSNHQDQPGYGLGLYICKKLLKGMEGDIYAQNTEDGVRIVVVLRLAG